MIEKPWGEDPEIKISNENGKKEGEGDVESNDY